jgi:hypothetical protein
MSTGGRRLDAVKSAEVARWSVVAVLRRRAFLRGRVDKRIRCWAVALVSRPVNDEIWTIGRPGVSIFVLRNRSFILKL